MYSKITKLTHECGATKGLEVNTSEIQAIAPLNRQERRRQKYKKGIANPNWHSGKFCSNQVEVTIKDSEPFTPGETVADHIKDQDAFHRLVDGSGCENDFLRLAIVLNICKVRAMDIDEQLAHEIELAQDAMNRVRERYLNTKRFGFDAIGLKAVQQALIHNEVIVNASSRKQMESATATMLRIVDEQQKLKGDKSIHSI